MSKSVRQICLMARDSDLCRFWADSYGLIADVNKTFFMGNIVDEQGHDSLFKDLKNSIAADKITHLLIDLSSIHFDPFLLFDLKRQSKIVIIALAIDDEMKFSSISSTIATIADLVITTDYTSVPRYRQSGINAHFLPLPVFIPNELPTVDQHLQRPLSFIGRKAKDKPLREMYLDILERETNISIFGNQGTQSQGFLSTEEMYSLFRNSVINLNFTGITVYSRSNNALFERIRGMKLRPFEIYAAGGMCVSEYSISLAKCFKDGEEIVFFKNPAEMLEKVEYYLNHKDEADRVALAGRSKVINNYSAKATAENLKNILESSTEYIGNDLFGIKHELSVSSLYAVTLVELITAKLLAFSAKGKFLLVMRELRYMARFLKMFSLGVGYAETARIFFLGGFRSMKTAAVNAKRRLLKEI